MDRRRIADVRIEAVDPADAPARSAEHSGVAP
jgi:hypothetical protein